MAEYREGTTDRAQFPLPDVGWPPTAPYWAGAAAGELRIPFCDACAASNWYPDDRCGACGADRFSWRVMSGRGTVFSWVVVHRPFLKQYAELVPYVPALVALDDAPEVRVPTRLVDIAPEQVRFDLAVAVMFRPLRFAGVEGEVIAPLFAPLDGASLS